MDNIRIHFVPLGGVVGVTKNMYVYELWKNETLEDIIIVDCGVGFSREKDFGVDFMIPDIRYLQDKKDKIRAILLTHGHEDHISALRFHYQALGSPPIFASRLTSLFAQDKCKEVGVAVTIQTVMYRKPYQFGGFEVSFIELTHSIPDTTHILIKTPVGNFYHGSDFKLDLTPPYGNPPDFYSISKAGEEGVVCLLSDSLGAEHEGWTKSEKIVGRTFDHEIRNTQGMFVMTTFSSNISRIRQCAQRAISHGRSICFVGRSMKHNSELAIKEHYLPIPTSSIIKEEDIPRLPPEKICLIVAGSQGQYDSALSKIADHQNPYIKLGRGDRVMFSSDPIPGYEDEVYDLIERLSLSGAEVIYSDIHEELHASGHGNQEDLKMLVRLTKPRFLLPIGGTIRHQQQYMHLAKDMGYEEDRIFLLSDGDTMWFQTRHAQMGERIDIKQVFVDAYGIGDVGTIILRDRETLSKEGVVVAILIIDEKHTLLTNPQFVSRGFVFGKDQQELFDKAEKEIEKTLKSYHDAPFGDETHVRRDLIKRLESFFHHKTGRNPLVAVEIIRI